jgi:hypothetical protein
VTQRVLQCVSSEWISSRLLAEAYSLVVLCTRRFRKGSTTESTPVSLKSESKGRKFAPHSRPKRTSPMVARITFIVWQLFYFVSIPKDASTIPPFILLNELSCRTCGFAHPAFFSSRDCAFGFSITTTFASRRRGTPNLRFGSIPESNRTFDVMSDELLRKCPPNLTASCVGPGAATKKDHGLLRTMAQSQCSLFLF